MNLARFFDPNLIEINLKAKTKIEAIEKLTDLFCKKYPEKNKDEIIQSVIEREDYGSTSFGRGFAFPHARTDAVNDLFIVFGICREGIKTDAADQIPLKVVCLLLTPRNISRLYLQTLSALAGLARRPDILNIILKVDSPENLIKLVERTNIRIKKALVVSDIMSEKTPTVSMEDSLKKVANIMFKHRLYGVPVLDSNKRLVGEVSEKELLKFALPDYESFIANIANVPELESFEDTLKQSDKILVKDVMNKNVETVFKDTQVVEAAALMLFKDIDRVMVVENNKFIGMISRTDIVSKIIRG
ncbi:MAG: PTS sugar transporter subunit IIA [Candidatus Zixiibacteriota bacterium]|nr:MAG: PTS sugar transporter subunit IIA [candidate division Zixibacteria bacterium]